MGRLATCNHCGLPIKEWGSKKQKMCMSCYRRFIKAKQNHTEYIPVLVLPEKEKQKIINRRVSHNSDKLSNKKGSTNTIVLNNASNVKYQNEKDIVYEDIENSFNSKGIKTSLNNESLLPLFSQLKFLLEHCEDTYKEHFIAEDILNKMELDYKHAKEYYSSTYNQMLDNGDNEYLSEVLNKKIIWEERHNILLEYRRNVRNKTNEFRNVGTFLLELANDKKFMDKFYESYGLLVKGDEYVADKNYKAELSRLVEKEDFCLGFKSRMENHSKFNVSIKTRYLGQTSVFNRQVFAIDEEDAKNQVIKFIQDRPEKFKFTWKSNEIYVTRLQDNPRQK